MREVGPIAANQLRIGLGALASTARSTRPIYSCILLFCTHAEVCIWCSIARTDQEPRHQAIFFWIASSFRFRRPHHAAPPWNQRAGPQPSRQGAPRRPRQPAAGTARCPPPCPPPPSPCRRFAPLQEQYKRVGDQVNETKLQLMKSQMEQFRGSLEDFALKHRQDIRQDPVFRWARGAVGAGLAGRPPAPLGGC